MATTSTYHRLLRKASAELLASATGDGEQTRSADDSTFSAATRTSGIPGLNADLKDVIVDRTTRTALVIFFATAIITLVSAALLILLWVIAGICYFLTFLFWHHLKIFAAMGLFPKVSVSAKILHSIAVLLLGFYAFFGNHIHKWAEKKLGVAKNSTSEAEKQKNFREKLLASFLPGGGDVDNEEDELEAQSQQTATGNKKASFLRLVLTRYHEESKNTMLVRIKVINVMMLISPRLHSQPFISFVHFLPGAITNQTETCKK